MPLDLQPTLLGTLISMRPLRADDHETLYAVASDPLIWEQHPERTRYQRPVFDVFFADALKSGGALLAINRDTGAIIGSSRYHDYSATKREVEIGWSFLARAFWGGRYNGEMKRLMLEHAFPWVDRVLFVIGPHNLRSQRAVEKIGGVLAGRKLDDKGEERLVFSLTQAQYTEASEVR